MRIEFTGRHTTVSERVRTLAERKLRKLARLLPRVSSAHVVLALDGHRHEVEVTLHSPQLDLAATETGGDFSAALRAALDKLERQAQRRKERRRELKRRPGAPPPRPRATPPPARPALRGKRAAVRAMTLEEAILEMHVRDERPLVFRDAEVDRVKVLFRRKDGQLGLLEPEL